MASTSPVLQRAREQLAVANRKLSVARSNASGKGKAGLRVGAVVLGSAAGGALTAKFPEFAGIDTRAIVGAGLVAGGIFGLKGQWAEAAMLAGAGMLGAWADNMANDKVGEMLGADEVVP